LKGVEATDGRFWKSIKPLKNLMALVWLEGAKEQAVEHDAEAKLSTVVSNQLGQRIVELTAHGVSTKRFGEASRHGERIPRCRVKEASAVAGSQREVGGLRRRDSQWNR
jgi:hypothetical protein